MSLNPDVSHVDCVEEGNGRGMRLVETHLDTDGACSPWRRSVENIGGPKALVGQGRAREQKNFFKILHFGSF